MDGDVDCFGILEEMKLRQSPWAVLQSRELHRSPGETGFDEMIEVWRAQVGVETTEWSPGECCWLLPVCLSASQVNQGGGQVPAKDARMIR